ncbi:hypothetical protein ACFLZV_01150 [Candidatus Margulisiibacteriota bacterium]
MQIFFGSLQKSYLKLTKKTNSKKDNKQIPVKEMMNKLQIRIPKRIQEKKALFNKQCLTFNVTLAYAIFPINQYHLNELFIRFNMEIQMSKGPEKTQKFWEHIMEQVADSKSDIPKILIEITQEEIQNIQKENKKTAPANITAVSTSPSSEPVNSSDEDYNFFD